jgi:ubiquinone/menaquinone biosynthesis C-methylase UbiE
MADSPSVLSSPVQTIHLDDLPKGRLILDIGGGGEGLVSRIGGKCVCAVDYRMSEILEAKIHGPPANWFAADARSLPFRDRSFDMVTLWFSLEYMAGRTTKERIFTESFGALKRGGDLSIYAGRIDCKKERFIFNALFILPDGTVSKVGYGVQGNQGQTIDSVCSLLKKVGFDGLQIEDNDWWFKIHAHKS